MASEVFCRKTCMRMFPSALCPRESLDSSNFTQLFQAVLAQVYGSALLQRILDCSRSCCSSYILLRNFFFTTIIICPLIRFNWATTVHGQPGPSKEFLTGMRFKSSLCPWVPGQGPPGGGKLTEKASLLPVWRLLCILAVRTSSQEEEGGILKQIIPSVRIC